MSVLTCNNLGLSFGAFDVFQGLSFTIASDSKVGLIGPNGVGKTSLLRILAGIIRPSVGVIHIARDRRLGYLRQEAMEAFANKENSVYDEMLTVFSDLINQQKKLRTMEEEMSNGKNSDSLLSSYGDLLEAFEHGGGFDYEQQIKYTLQGLGLGKGNWDKPLSYLSGGEKTRALLARLLLEKPDILLLDEPTNHLDVDAVEWLEHTLTQWDGAVLIVSHDRYFLESSVNAIWDMRRDRIEVYSGGYNEYLLQREERWEYYERVFKEEKARLLKEIDFVQKNWVRASSHARALGRLRLIYRDLNIIDHFGVMALRNGTKWHETGLTTNYKMDVIDAIRRINAISLTNNRPPQLRPQLATNRVGGNIVLRAENAVIGYPGNELFTIAGLELRRGECAALMGPNGSGKTTFLKTLLDQLEPLDGEVRLGAGLKIGYFAQVHDSLEDDMTVLEEIQRHQQFNNETARRHLARYLFRGEDVEKHLRALSGGERARLALAILDLQGANFLLLDEPTNHLDISAQEVLQEILEIFAGTVLLVSHDRYLINRLASQIWELRDGKLDIYAGSYREYMLQRVSKGVRAESRPAVLLQRKIIRVDGKEARMQAQIIAQLEQRIQDKERDLRKLTQRMQNAGKQRDHVEINEIGQRIAVAQSDLDSLISDWEKIAV